MQNSDIIYADPFLNNKASSTGLPNGCSFVCAYELFISTILFEEAVFFYRTKTADELWISTDDAILPTVKQIVKGTTVNTDTVAKELLNFCCVFAVKRNGRKSVSCINLLEELFRSRVGFCAPSKFLSAGMVDEIAFNKLTDRIKLDLDVKSRKAREAETEIIRVARELSLCPEPTGTDPKFWQARCPDRNHPLYINAEENTFGCGWCKRKGGVKDLRAFVKDRKEGSERPH